MLSMTAKTTKRPASGLPLDSAADDVKGMCYAYIRVSMAEQAESGISVPAQQAICRRFYDQRLAGDGWQWGGFIVDEGVTTKIPLRDRKGGAQVLQKLRQGDALVSLRSDRVFRSLADAATMIEDLLARGVVVGFAANGQMVTDDDITSKMYFGILASVDQFSRELTAARTKEVLREKAMRGEAPRRGSPPLGFRYDGGYIVADDNEREVMKQILKWRQQGSSCKQITQMLKQANRRRTHSRTFWTYSQVTRAVQAELRLQDIQQRLAEGELDPYSVPPQYRTMHQLSSCRKEGSDDS